MESNITSLLVLSSQILLQNLFHHGVALGCDSGNLAGAFEIGTDPVSQPASEVGRRLEVTLDAPQVGLLYLELRILTK
jgi:hypothetical protein